MAEGPAERPVRASLPHILVPWAATEQPYRGRAGGAGKPIRQIGDRRAHAGKLSGELEAARDAAQERVAEISPEIAANGFALSVEAWSDDPSYKLAVQSLDTSGAKLLSVVPATDQMPDRAVVWLPFSAIPAFFRKIEQFAAETTSKGVPRNQALVANIAELRLDVLHDLWQEPEQFPEPEEVRWWEVWLARFEPGRSGRNAWGSGLRVSPETNTASTGPGATLRAIAAEQGWPMAPGLLAFPENVVALLRTSAAELGVILSTSAVPSELHRARVTSEILSVSPLDQNEFVAELSGRIKAADPDAGAVCVLDTGLMSGHTLLSTSVDRTLSALEASGSATHTGMERAWQDSRYSQI